MTTYFVAPDGHDEPTLWAVSGNQHAVPVIRRSDVPKFWPDIVARMTGATITTDDATVEKVARSLYEFKFSSERLPDPLPWDHPRMDEFAGDWVREQYRPQARAILAALTGAPVEPVDTHRHYYVDISTFAAADAGRHNWLCECGATDETRDRA